MATTQDTVHAVMRERGSVYGEPHHSHKNIGLAWTGILQQHYGIELPHPIPHSIVELMMVSFKLQRSSRVYHKDNFVDAKAYLEFAEHAQANPGEPFVSHAPVKPEGVSESVLVGTPASK